MRLRLPIGYDNFYDVIRQGFHFVDKSLLITEILDDPSQVMVLTRPRRFGKTLNLSMLHHFLASEVSGQSTQGLFEGLKISQASAKYLAHQGHYPVVALTLKGVKDHTFEKAYNNLCTLLAQLYEEHEYLLQSEKLTPRKKAQFETILMRTADQAKVATALQDLSYYLYQHTGIKPWIIIDEYDAPIQSAYVYGYYEEMISLMRNFFGAALKSNRYLHRAVMTGILRISKESIFSDLNNLQIYGVLQSQYGAYFGFTECEVADLLKQTGLQSHETAVRDWYNGYRIGKTVVYNPWSIINFIHFEGTLEPYWVNTSDNTLIKDLLVRSSDHFKAQFEQLLLQKPVEKLIDERMVFSDLWVNETSAWSLLLMAGYLKVISQRSDDQGLHCTVNIPNQEVRNLYRQIIEKWLANGHGIDWYNGFLDHLLSGELEAFQQDLQEVMESIVSSHDVARGPEAFYHGLMIGLTASLYQHPNYEIHSNRESGYGRYDYLIFSRDPLKPTLLLEFKRVNKTKDSEQLTLLLEQAAEDALAQIAQQKYAAEAKQRGCQKLIKIGIAFSGKHFAIRWESAALPE